MRTIRAMDVVRGGLAALVVAGVALAQSEEGPTELRVEFASPHDGAVLVGSLVTPAGDGPHAAALFVNATGSHPRDEARSGGSQWKHLATALAEAGVASLRLDARGTGESVSEGVESWEYRWTSEELALDSAKAMEALRSMEGIDAERTGMVCFSDGCAIGAIAATGMLEAPAFMVMLSPSGVPARLHLFEEQRSQLAMTGATEEQMEQILPVIERALETLASDAPAAAARQAVINVLLAMGAPEEQAAMSADAALEELGQRGVRWHLGFDPAPVFAAMDAPTLAIVGGDDDRLPHPESVPALRAALGADAVVVLDGLGHFLEGDQAEAFAAAVVDRVVGFAAGKTE